MALTHMRGITQPAKIAPAVLDLIKKGWQPLGEICFAPVKDTPFMGHYSQAMAKYEV